MRKETWMSIPYVAQAAGHQQLEWLRGGVMNILLDGAKTDDQVMMFRSTLPGGSATPVHVHDREDEVFLLLEGSGVFWAGEQRYELTDGGIAFLPRQVPHAYLLTSETVKMIGLSVPAGLEHFFRAAGWDRSQPKPEGWVLTPEIMARAAAATGQNILGPPLSAGDAVIPAAYLGGRDHRAR
jgi:quercetin dioxygenase-like cupin family protein